MPAGKRKSLNGPLLSDTTGSQEPKVAVQVTDHEHGQSLVGLRVPGHHEYVYVPVNTQQQSPAKKE